MMAFRATLPARYLMYYLGIYYILGIPLRGLLSARLVAMYIAVAIRPRVLLIQ